VTTLTLENNPGERHDLLHCRGSMLSSVLALTAVAAATTAAAEPVSSFRCEKRAFYPTAGAYAGKPGGTRHVMIPQSMCADVADGGEIMQALCCANTHVNCSSAFTEPTLVSYDGSHYPLKNEQHKTSTAETVLADADRRLCSMMMADKCSDCDRSKCSLFSKSPVPKKCYSRTYTDKPDGSGWIKNATASASATAECPPIATQGQFNLTEWIRASWFIQEQQINGFQEPEDLFCVVATYKDEGRTVRPALVPIDRSAVLVIVDADHCAFPGATLGRHSGQRLQLPEPRSGQWAWLRSGGGAPMRAID
jgi:hypothetical protein